MNFEINDKMFLHYINEMLLDFKSYPYGLDKESKKLIKDLEIILIKKSISLMLIDNLVPYLISQIEYYENLPYDLQNQFNRKSIYEEQKYIFSYIQKYFHIIIEDGGISINSNETIKLIKKGNK
jgi:hypothetical protein